MGIEQIQKIHEFGEINVIISLLLCAMLAIALKAGWEKLLDALGLETKASLQKKALEKKLSDMEQKIADFEQSQHNYHDQSINIRDDLRTNQNTLSTQLTDLTTLMQNFITNQDECTVASFRSSLWRMHRDFMAQGYITPDGLKTFLEMGKLYERPAEMIFIMRNYFQILNLWKSDIQKTMYYNLWVVKHYTWLPIFLL